MKKTAGKRLSFLVTLALSAGLGTAVHPSSACAAEINVTTDRTADVDGGAANGNKVTIGAEGGGHPVIAGNIIGGSAAVRQMRRKTLSTSRASSWKPLTPSTADAVLPRRQKTR